MELFCYVWQFVNELMDGGKKANEVLLYVFWLGYARFRAGNHFALAPSINTPHFQAVRLIRMNRRM